MSREGGSVRADPERVAAPAATAGELGPRLGAVEGEALAVEAVDELARDGVVERDGIGRVLPAQGADVDALERGLEPFAEPGVALAVVAVDPLPDLAADGVNGGVPGEDAVVEAGLGGDDEEG